MITMLTKEQLDEIRARASGLKPYGPKPLWRDTVDDIRALLDHADALAAENAGLREALGFYADRDNWPGEDWPSGNVTGIYTGTPIDEDDGRIARAALGEK